MIGRFFVFSSPLQIFSHFISIHLRHLHVDDGEIKIVIQGSDQGFVAAPGPNHISLGFFQHFFQDVQIFLLVIYNQDILTPNRFTFVSLDFIALFTPEFLFFGYSQAPFSGKCAARVFHRLKITFHTCKLN